MQEAGYNTYYTGKLYNSHSIDNYDAPLVSGFNGSDFILDPSTYEYYNAWMTRNGAPPVSYEGQYSPDVVFEKTRGFLHEALLHPEPWFITAAPIAPHSNVKLEPEQEFGPARYAERHAHLFKDYKIPRTSNFNPDTQSGVGWIKRLPKLNDTVIDYNDEFQRSRLRALQSVDEGVESLIKELEAAGQLDNTYIFYTTDNGYHLSQHRMFAGKECGYDTDIHIPLIVRGPGIPAGHVTEAVTSHTDLSPTILKLAGESKDTFDGTPIPLEAEEVAKPSKSEHVNVEFWGWGIPEGIYGSYAPEEGQPDIYGRSAPNNTYKGLRLVGEDYSLYYSVWCHGEREYYDVKVRQDIEVSSDCILSVKHIVLILVC
jgi:N-acetylglucosamine-6-sulfatase